MCKGGSKMINFYPNQYVSSDVICKTLNFQGKSIVSLHYRTITLNNCIIYTVSWLHFCGYVGCSIYSSFSLFLHFLLKDLIHLISVHSLFRLLVILALSTKIKQYSLFDHFLYLVTFILKSVLMLWEYLRWALGAMKLWANILSISSFSRGNADLPSVSPSPKG